MITTYSTRNNIFLSLIQTIFNTLKNCCNESFIDDKLCIQVVQTILRNQNETQLKTVKMSVTCRDF